MLEKEVEKYLTDQVLSLKGMSIKLVLSAGKGFPDRTVVLPDGRVFFIELKRPKGGVISAAQKKWICKLSQMNCDVRVIRTKKEVDLFIEELSKNYQRTNNLRGE